MEMIEKLGRAMFLRRCELDGAEPVMAELAWVDANVRRFWIQEASHVIEVLDALPAQGLRAGPA